MPAASHCGQSELFFIVVAGEEDLAVLVEAVNQTFDAVGHGRTHCSKIIGVRCCKSRRSQKLEARVHNAEAG